MNYKLVHISEQTNKENQSVVTAGVVDLDIVE